MTRPEPTIALIDRFLEVIEADILPLTKVGVAKGNKVFGAALLNKDDGSLLLAETNNELLSPLLHGEMQALQRYYELPKATRPAPEDLLFLSTHEPCSLCMSAITWAGFDNFFYFFSHEDSRDAFDIPHDLKILKEVFDVNPGEYRTSNAFWDSYSIQRLADELDSGDGHRSARQTRMYEISKQFNALSEQYQSSKGDNAIPLN